MADRVEALERSRGGVHARTLDRLQQLSGQASIVEDVSERVRGLEQSTGRMRDMDEVLNQVVKDLDRVVTRTATLDDAMNRIAALERSLPDEQPLRPEVTQGLKRLAAEVDRLRAVPARMAALEQAQGKVPAGALMELRDQLTALSAEVRRLKSPPDRSRTLDELSSRLAKLEQAVPARGPDHSKALAGVQAHLERLSTQVAALRAVPGRVQALEQAQGRSGTSDEELAALRRDVEEVSGRLEGLEGARARTDEMLQSIGKRFDRVGTRLGALKNVPDRLELLEKMATDADTADGGFERLRSDVVAVAETIEGLTARLHRLEQGSVRSDALARGLSAAIDALDQLSVQVATLEHTVHRSGQSVDSQRRAR